MGGGGRGRAGQGEGGVRHTLRFYQDVLESSLLIPVAPYLEADPGL